jgi:hypothetical protein
MPPCVASRLPPAGGATLVARQSRFHGVLAARVRHRSGVTPLPAAQQMGVFP